MIKIMVLSGQYAGQERTAAEVAEMGITPADLLADLARHGVRWRVVYPPDTIGRLIDDASETQRWAIADMAARIVHAVRDGRPVRLLGQMIDTTGAADPAKLVGELEDMIVESGRKVTIIRDDEHGVIIGSPEM